MIGNLYRLFYHYRNAMPADVFEEAVLPYFSAHISIDEKSREQVIKGDAIEFQHGERALRDVLRQLKTPYDVKMALSHMLAFLQVQELKLLILCLLNVRESI